MLAEPGSSFCLELGRELLSQLPVSFAYRHLYEGVSDYELSEVESSFDSSLLVRMSSKRKREFLVGRLLSRDVIKMYMSSNQYAQVGPNRAPIWPKGLVGSISHTNTWAVALAAESSKIRRVGVDIESLASVDRVDGIEAMVCRSGELGALRGMPRLQALSLAFSAKESLFKALYPEYGEYFDYLDAYISAHEGNKVILTLAKDLGGVFSLGCTFSVNYIFDSDYILTWHLDLL